MEEERKRIVHEELRNGRTSVVDELIGDHVKREDHTGKVSV
jgi:hypothetical protein